MFLNVPQFEGSNFKTTNETFQCFCNWLFLLLLLLFIFFFLKNLLLGHVNTVCPANYFRCPDGSGCRLIAQLCDGTVDCSDGWDEGDFCRMSFLPSFLIYSIFFFLFLSSFIIIYFIFSCVFLLVHLKKKRKKKKNVICLTVTRMYHCRVSVNWKLLKI